MLTTRIDLKLLRRISRRSVALLGNHGSASALWYLQIKNLVLAVHPLPRSIVIFFRDTFLTQPHFRTEGQYREELQRTSHRRELEMTRILETPHGVIAHLVHGAERAFPTLRTSQQVQEKLRDLVRRRMTREKGKEFKKRFSVRFAVERLRTSLASDAREEREELSFRAVVENSFLPAIVALVRDQHVQLVLYRVKRRSRTGAETDPPWLTQYLTELRRYIQAHGGELVDESNDQSIPLSWYADGDHITRGARPQYTQKTWKRLLSVLR